MGAGIVLLITNDDETYPPRSRIGQKAGWEPFRESDAEHNQRGIAFSVD
jgi:hypothetical protein